MDIGHDDDDNGPEGHLDEGSLARTGNESQQPDTLFDEEEQDPARWWFIASAFPLIAGTLGPVASAFSICALARQWRQYVPPNGDISKGIFIPDPNWLLAINAIQLALAIVSNVFLLLNMTRRVRFSVAQPITIAGWYISAICLIALCATASGPLAQGEDPKKEYMWSQAFYYGIWAAILYFVVASLMSVTFWAASTGHFSKGFDLTNSQRSLMLQTIMFLMYLLIGALVFSNIEGWNYLDAVYWADVTLFTVGFGDLSTNTTLGRALLFPYALIGVISLGLVISSIRSMILDRARRRVGVRMQELTRRKLVRRLTRQGTDDVLNPVSTNSSSYPERTTNEDGLSHAELARRKEEFQLMRKVQAKSLARRRWMAMAISTSTWLLLWLLGALVFWETEKNYQPDWGYFDSFYLCFVSLTTIGYGDKTPISNAGKSFFVFWSLLALPTMTVLISNAGDTVVKFIRDTTLRIGAVTILPSNKVCSEDSSPPSRQSDKNSPENQTPAATGSPATSLSRASQPKNSNSEKRHYPDTLQLTKNQNSGHHNTPHHRRIRHTTTSSDEPSIPQVHRRLGHVPQGRKFHLLLISEIQAVMEHIRDQKGRRYTYEEWAWYLRLLGEDERSPETHRRARVHEKKHLHQQEQQQHEEQNRKTSSSEEMQEQGDQQETAEVHKWSWVGGHSPLSGGHEESEWLLERLTCTLKKALEDDTEQ